MNQVLETNNNFSIIFIILILLFTGLLFKINRDVEYNKKKQHLLDLGFKQSYYYTLPDDGEVFIKYDGNDKKAISEKFLRQMSKQDWILFLGKNK